MGRYVVKRILLAVPTVLIVAIVAFLIIRLMPGDPATTMLGTNATPEAIATLRHNLGLDLPLYNQFLHWMYNLLQGNFGNSLVYQRPVLQLIWQRFPITLQLSGVALLFALLIGIPTGVLAAVKQGKIYDQIILILALLGLALPDFWLGLSLVALLSVQLGVFPTGGFVPISAGIGPWFEHLFLPGLTLGFIHAALITRMTRSTMLDILKQEFIRTARAKGLSEFFVVMKHALKNTLVPVITVIGLSVAILLGGAVIVENVFTLPGIGWLIVNAVQGRDFPVIQGAIVMIAMVNVVVNLIVDILYQVIDPKIKYQ